MGIWVIGRVSDSSVQSVNLSNGTADTEYPLVARCFDIVGFGKRVQ